MSKTGKHGHAKVMLVGVDPVTGKRVEHIMPASGTLQLAPPEDQDEVEDVSEEEEDASEEEAPRPKAPIVQLGGKGTPRRKKKKHMKSAASQDDKKLSNTLASLGVDSVPVEQVDLHQQDGSVIHFDNPQVKADMASNMLVVQGSPQTQKPEPEPEATPAYIPPASVQKITSAALEGLLQPLIQLQQLDGKWELSQHLAQLIEVPLSDLTTLMESLLGADSSCQAVLATALAISICEKGLPHRKDEWNLLVKKAWSWLKEQEVGAKGAWRALV
eukprot:CAMPEP_0168556852 /NCGR_PEP_ID=MMETSP0413-20121227/9106_1 /TAXON_ID=136452 /ORGANISM="Filamoeba nolandi, Strain NC-AS-23-1" /LENGTH=272 /DNA_ID=CAMNT_0008587831 /DNA_START=170 /DNA_END=984 /DNA_ORIENTATION=-